MILKSATLALTGSQSTVSLYLFTESNHFNCFNEIALFITYEISAITYENAAELELDYFATRLTRGPPRPYSSSRSACDSSAVFPGNSFSLSSRRIKGGYEPAVWNVQDN